MPPDSAGGSEGVREPSSRTDGAAGLSAPEGAGAVDGEVAPPEAGSTVGEDVEGAVAPGAGAGVESPTVGEEGGDEATDGSEAPVPGRPESAGTPEHAASDDSAHATIDDTTTAGTESGEPDFMFLPIFCPSLLRLTT